MDRWLWKQAVASAETAVTPIESAGTSEYSASMDDSTSTLNKGVEVASDMAWKPSRQVKMVLAGQAFCVFIVSLDMTILTATLPVRDPLNGLVK